MREIKILTCCVSVLTVIAVCAVLSVAQSVFMPLVIAWLLSYLVTPFVRFMTSRRVPMSVIVFIVLTILLAFAVLGGTFLSTSLSGFITDFPSYYERLLAIGKDVLQRLGLSLDSIGNFSDWGVEVRSYLLSFSGSLVTLTSKTVMVVIFLVFIIVGSPYVDSKVRKAFSSESSVRVLNILATISRQIGRFLSLETLIGIATGLCVWIAMKTLGVQSAATWGILAFALNFIPTVGSIVASIPPIVVAIVQFYPETFTPVAATVSLLVIQMGIGNIITPKVMGDNLNLSPVSILMSLLFWGWLWGVGGMLLSVPLIAIVKIVCENVKPLNMISVFLSSGSNFKDDFNDGQNKKTGALS